MEALGYIWGSGWEHHPAMQLLMLCAMAWFIAIRSAVLVVALLPVAKQERMMAVIQERMVELLMPCNICCGKKLDVTALLIA
jgi:hypothetical protein